MDGWIGVLTYQTTRSNIGWVDAWMVLLVDIVVWGEEEGNYNGSVMGW